tara:strand:- start:17638 stop:18729 length:1092 start_codon:yes stop_codon:yes gene_type:complete
MKPGRTRIEASTATTMTIDGTTHLAFAGTNFLGLAHHPDVHEAVRATLATCGLSASASRETSGNFAAHERLEESLAEFLGVEAALLVPDGWLANVALFEAFAGEIRCTILDADSHPALWHAARQIDGRLLDYGSGDLMRAHALADRYVDEHMVIATDGVFPRQGRYAELGQLLRMLPPTGLCVVDDSHGLGLIGTGGRGTAHGHGLRDPRIVITASLAKSLGATGGVIAGSAATIERVRRRSETYAGTTPIPPAVAAGAVAALDVLIREPARVERLKANASSLNRLLRRLDLRPPGHTVPQVHLPVDEALGQTLIEHLERASIFVPFRGYGGGAARPIIAVNAEHKAADLTRLEEALREGLEA